MLEIGPWILDLGVKIGPNSWIGKSKNRLQPVVPQVVNSDPQTFIPLAKGAARLRRRLHRTTRGQIRPVASSHRDLGLGLHRGLSAVMS